MRRRDRVMGYRWSRPDAISAAEGRDPAVMFQNPAKPVADVLRGRAKCGVLHHHRPHESQQSRYATEDPFVSLFAFPHQNLHPGLDLVGVGVEGLVCSRPSALLQKRADFRSAEFDKVVDLAFDEEGEDIEEDASEGEDIGHLRQDPREVAEGVWVWNRRLR